jgi:hypothetical protein
MRPTGSSVSQPRRSAHLQTWFKAVRASDA